MKVIGVLEFARVWTPAQHPQRERKDGLQEIRHNKISYCPDFSGDDNANIYNKPILLIELFTAPVPFSAL
jgi:hypothetical protein